MKLTVRTLQNATFPVTIELSNTVAELKAAIFQVQESSPPERQKLIHSGRILVDDKQLSSYEIKDGDFIVLMITKPSAAVASSSPSVMQKEENGKETPASATNSAEFTSSVDRLVEMGFDREGAGKALKAAFMNVDRAVEYLSSGNIPQIDEEQAASSPASTTLTPELEALKNSPGFHQLRAAVQQNPDLLYYVIDQIAETNPQLLTMIEQNREAFFRLLTGDDTLTLQSEGEDDEEDAAIPEEAAGEEEELERDEVEQQMFEQAVMQQLNASPEDASAIQRIMDMGFDRNAAIEAYFACDRNEELAINFLLNQH